MNKKITLLLFAVITSSFALSIFAKNKNVKDVRIKSLANDKYLSVTWNQNKWQLQANKENPYHPAAKFQLIKTRGRSGNEVFVIRSRIAGKRNLKSFEKRKNVEVLFEGHKETPYALWTLEEIPTEGASKLVQIKNKQTETCLQQSGSSNIELIHQYKMVNPKNAAFVIEETSSMLPGECKTITPHEKITANSPEHAWKLCKGKAYRFKNGSWVRSNLRKELKDISVGGDGDTWAIDTHNNVYRLVGNTWAKVPHKKFKKISVGNRNHAYAINTNNHLYKWDGEAWTRQKLKSVGKTSGSRNNREEFSDVATGYDNGPTYATLYSKQRNHQRHNKICRIEDGKYSFLKNDNAWHKNKFKKIAVNKNKKTGEEMLWAIGPSGELAKWNSHRKTFEYLADGIKDISIGSDGTVLGITRNKYVINLETVAGSPKVWSAAQTFAKIYPNFFKTMNDARYEADINKRINMYMTLQPKDILASNENLQLFMEGMKLIIENRNESHLEPIKTLVQNVLPEIDYLQRKIESEGSASLKETKVSKTLTAWEHDPKKLKVKDLASNPVVRFKSNSTGKYFVAKKIKGKWYFVADGTSADDPAAKFVVTNVKSVPGMPGLTTFSIKSSYAGSRFLRDTKDWRSLFEKKSIHKEEQWILKNRENNLSDCIMQGLRSKHRGWLTTPAVKWHKNAPEFAAYTSSSAVRKRANTESNATSFSIEIVSMAPRIVEVPLSMLSKNDIDKTKQTLMSYLKTCESTVPYGTIIKDAAKIFSERDGLTALAPKIVKGTDDHKAFMLQTELWLNKLDEVVKRKSELTKELSTPLNELNKAISNYISQYGELNPLVMNMKKGQKTKFETAQKNLSNLVVQKTAAEKSTPEGLELTLSSTTKNIFNATDPGDIQDQWFEDAKVLVKYATQIPVDKLGQYKELIGDIENWKDRFNFSESKRYQRNEDLETLIKEGKKFFVLLIKQVKENVRAASKKEIDYKDWLSRLSYIVENINPDDLDQEVTDVALSKPTTAGVPTLRDFVKELSTELKSYTDWFERSFSDDPESKDKVVSLTNTLETKFATPEYKQKFIEAKETDVSDFSTKMKLYNEGLDGVPTTLSDNAKMALVADYIEPLVVDAPTNEKIYKNSSYLGQIKTMLGKAKSLHPEAVTEYIKTIDNLLTKVKPKPKTKKPAIHLPTKPTKRRYHRRR